jgi:uncharacterized protein YqjF (DUF2071 family)
MKQRWHDLLFAHWRVEPDALRAVVPPQLPIDTFDGSAWVGVTPFRIEGFRPRGLPPPPGLSSFLEANVRTYATVGGVGGIFFFSLDCESRLAVRGARRFWRLPYFHASMDMERRGDAFEYRLARTSDDGPPAALELDYAPTGPVRRAEAGSLEHFLTERYCLYTLDDSGRIVRGDIDHVPWPLQPARTEIRRNTMGEQVGLALDGEPLAHFSRRQDVIFWPIRPV